MGFDATKINELRRLKEEAAFAADCPFLQWQSEDFSDFWRHYGGDSWLYWLWSNTGPTGQPFEFWEQLHEAGTRGLFVVEIVWSMEPDISTPPTEKFDMKLFGTTENGTAGISKWQT